MRLRDQTRHALTRRGAAALRSWVEGVPAPDGDALLDEVRTRYWRLAPQVPWPRRHALRLHLVFSALSGAAVYGALRDRGWAEDDAVGAVADVIARRTASHRRHLQRLTRHRALRAGFLPAARIVTRVAFPSPGWEARWRERSADTVAFDMTRCYLLDTFMRLGCPEITRAYCAGDDALYGDLCPQLRWRRTGTLGTGADVCDFRFERIERSVAP